MYYAHEMQIEWQEGFSFQNMEGMMLHCFTLIKTLCCIIIAL